MRNITATLPPDVVVVEIDSQFSKEEGKRAVPCSHQMAEGRVGQ